MSTPCFLRWGFSHRTTFGFFINNEMQTPNHHPPPTPLPSPFSKRDVFIFLPKKLRIVLKRMKNQFSDMVVQSILIQQMCNVLKWIFELLSFLPCPIQIAPPPLRSGHIYMKDAHTDESNETHELKNHCQNNAHLSCKFGQHLNNFFFGP